MQRLRDGFITTTRGLPRAYWVLWGSNMLDWLGKFVSFFLTLYLAEERGLSGAEIALVVTLNGIANVPSLFLGGFLADRIGRRRMIIIGFWLIALALVFLGMARGMVQIAAASLFLGMVNGLPRPSLNAMIADVVAPEDRKRAYALNHWAINVGAMIALPIAGQLANTSYVLLFVGDAVTSFAAGLLVLALIPATVAVQKAAQSPSDKRPISRFEVFRDRKALGLVFLVFLYGCVYHQTRLALPLDMRDNGVSRAEFGLLIGLNGLLIVALQMPFTRLTQKLYTPHVLAAGSVLLGVAYGICAYLTTLPFYILSITLLSIGEVLFFANAVALMADLAPIEKRGQYQSLFMVAWGPLAWIGSSLGGIVLDEYGRVALWMGCLILGGIIAFGWWLLGERLRGHAPAPALVENPA